MGSLEQPSHQAQVGSLTLVVGYDFSEASEFALATAARLVGPTGPNGVLHVVHTSTPATVPDVIATALPSLSPGMSSALAAVGERLDRACEIFAQGPGKDVRIVSHVVYGDPARGLATTARDLAADLIVVGTRRRKGVAIGWHRSLSARLVRLAPCSVLTARPKEQEEEVQVEPPCEPCLAVRRESAGKVAWCGAHSAHHVHAHFHHGDSQGFVSGSWTFRA
jgi:nucleotide-binding universal stress UspA family protein